MKCIFVLLVKLVSSNLLNLNLGDSLLPSFSSVDPGPYTAFSKSPLNLTSDCPFYFKLLVNSEFFSNNQTLSIDLPTGLHTLEIQCGSQNYQVEVGILGIFEANHSVSLSGSVCTQDCGETYVDLVEVTSSQAMHAKVFSLGKRHSEWQQVKDSLSLELGVLFNYVLLKHENQLKVYTVYKVPFKSQIKHLEFTVGNLSSFWLEPRFSPDIYEYTLSPSLDSSMDQLYSLEVFTYNTSFLTVSSSKGYFSERYSLSGQKVEDLLISDTGDSISIETEEETNSEPPNYYYVTINYKSRNRYLKSLQAYLVPVSTDLGNLTSPGSLERCCNFTRIEVLQKFHELRTQYSISPIDYTSEFSLALIGVPQDPKSSVELQGNYLGYQNYFNSSKVFSPQVGTNYYKFKVQAEDPSFVNYILVDFYMRSNNTDLAPPDIIGDWVPEFSPSVTTYRIYIPFSQTKIPVELRTSDSKATLSLNGVQKSYLQTSLNIQSKLTQTIEVLTQAETKTFTKKYIFSFHKKDECGNGLRFATEEECDDGNNLSGDGCNSACKLEKGYVCSGGSSSSKDTCEYNPQEEEPLPECGNGVVEDSEECDDGNTLSGDGCSGNCKLESNGEDCGDGLRVPGSLEECDDGNTLNGDGCSSNCQVEPGWKCSSTSLISNVDTFADTCELVGLGEVSKKEKSQEPKEDLTYIGVIAFFVVVCALIISMPQHILVSFFEVVDKKGLELLPGLAFTLVFFQVLYLLSYLEFKEDSVKKLLESFGWSHLRFSDIVVEGRVLLEVIELSSNNTDLFIENVQYLLLVFIGVALALVYFWAFSSNKKLKVYFVLGGYFFISYVPFVFYAGISLVSLSKDMDTYQLVSYISSLCLLISYLVLLGNLTWKQHKDQFSHKVFSQVFLKGITHYRTVHKNLSKSFSVVFRSENPVSFCNSSVHASPLDYPNCISEPASIYKVNSPELEVQPSVPVHRTIYLLELWAVSLCVLCVAVIQNLYLKTIPCIVILLVWGSTLFTAKPFVSSLYLVTHIVVAGGLAVFLFFYTIEEQLHYWVLPAIVVCLVSVVLMSLVFEFCCLLFLVLNSKRSEPGAVSQFQIEDPHYSESYAGVSIPEERKPNSPPINQFTDSVTLSQIQISSI